MNTVEEKSAKNLSCFVRELKKYKRDDLKTIFDCDDEKLKHVIRNLRNNKLLKIIKQKDNDNVIDMSDLTDEITDIQTVLNETNGYRYGFTYVGLLIVGDKVLKCYPKYIDGALEPEDEFKQVIKVITKYKLEETDIKSYNEEPDAGDVNKLAIMLYLLQDYYENGIYNNDHIVYEDNGRGEIMWDRTVNQTVAILQDDYPVYTDLITRKRVNDEYDYFRRLHKCIITECSQQFSRYGLYEYFGGYDEAELTDEDRSCLGDDDYISYRIDRELSEEFNTRKQQVLKAMQAYISSDSTNLDTEKIAMFGTRSFNIVWEKVCGTVLADQLNTELRYLELPKKLQIPKGLTDKNVLMDVIGHPRWHHYLETEPKVAEEHLIPDIVSFFNYKQKKYFAIFDGKYYYMQFEKGKPIMHQPGAGDITKQYLYQMFYADFITNHGFDIVKNCFVMPVEGSCSENKGYVCLDIFEGKLQRIDVLYLSANMVYHHYLKDNAGEQIIDSNFLGYIFDCNDQITYELDNKTHNWRFVYPTERELPKVAESKAH